MEYERTHPWINFKVDFRQIPAKLWIMLGECQSKCEHISRVPLKPKTSEELHLVYLAKGVAATTAIEGNTLTEEQVKLHLQGKLSLPVSQQYQQKEIDNIIHCCNLVLEGIKKGHPMILSLDTIKLFNKEILKDLPLDDNTIPGNVRRHSVGVANYRGAPADDCTFLLQKLCDWINSEVFQSSDELKIVYAIIKSIIAHLYTVWIHPFGDGNGRTARIIELMFLIGSGIPSPAAHLLSNHYNKTRQEYYRQLVASSASGGDIISFIAYSVQGFLDGLKEQIEKIWVQQWLIAWQNYVHEVLPDKGNKTQTRRRHLILDLSTKEEPVLLAQITELSTDVAREYAKRTTKTLTRDLNELIRLKLVEKTPKGYRALRETILKFLPTQKRT